MTLTGVFDAGAAMGGRLRFARPLGWRQARVLCWAGMRGVVTLAIAPTPPQAGKRLIAYPDRLMGCSVTNPR